MIPFIATMTRTRPRTSSWPRSIANPDKNWKLSRPDIEERQRWKDYRRAYEECLTATSTRTAPWYIVPADDKENARLIISQIILDSVDELKMSYPKPDKSHRKELQSIRKLLEK